MQKNTVLYRQQQVQYDLNNRAMKRKNAARQAFKKLENFKTARSSKRRNKMGPTNLSKRFL